MSYALSKLGNIIAEILYFLSMFSCLTFFENIEAGTKFSSHQAKMFVHKQIQKQCFLGKYEATRSVLRFVQI